jgi:hypothetical protein
VTSLALRFVGDFEKGIDFIGDADQFEETLTEHVIILQACGSYKLSVYSSSDKFMVFPIFGRQAEPKVHLKTAGTSYLEALQIPARHAPDFFREIVDYAFDCFETDRKTYHVSTDLDAIPAPDTVYDADLEAAYLDEDNDRQLLHITYRSVLTAKEDGEGRFKDRFLYQMLGINIQVGRLPTFELYWSRNAAPHVQPLRNYRVDRATRTARS